MEQNADSIKQEYIEKAESVAGEYFKQGLNCAECVFGGGMGQTRNTCGAITGAILALSALKGRNPFEKETPKERIQQIQQVYVPFKEMVQEIEQHYGTLICKELSAPHGDFAGKERKKNCKQVISYCAGLVAKYAQQNS